MKGNVIEREKWISVYWVAQNRLEIEMCEKLEQDFMFK